LDDSQDTYPLLDAADASTAADGPIYVTRFALAPLKVPQLTEQLSPGPDAHKLSDSVTESLLKALDKDSRVSGVLEIQEHFHVDNARTFTFNALDEGEEDLGKAIESYYSLRLNTAIRFRVHVPIKNQPRYRGLEDTPAEDYLVLWDGLWVAVQWSQETPRATGSGGHIALDVLEDVARSAGFEVKIIACAPGCMHRFAHADLVTFSGERANHSTFHSTGRAGVASTVVTPFSYASDDAVTLSQIEGALAVIMGYFAETKSVADGILFLEERARNNSAELLNISYLRASKRRFPHLLGWLKDSFRLLGSRSHSRKLIAEMWLSLALIESWKRSWNDRNAALAESLEAGNAQALASDLDDGRGVEDIDMTLVRESLQETATRMDGRAILWATLLGAVAVLAGAALAGVLT
jgi:hypothetical protein